jgi:4-aminobutyrate aminotransferase-like enzyme
MLDAAERGRHPIGAVLVEPVQGRGGIVVPAPGFFEGLRALCDGRTRVLIVDEIYTGFGRTGRWFACEHSGVTPDLLTTGKALSGSVPISAAIGTPEVMGAWPASTGEAVHTSTFLGNPIACAAALAQIEEIESRGLLGRAERIGAAIAERARGWAVRFPGVRAVRGIGALQAVELRGTLALDVCAAALRRGVLVLAEGPRLDALAITPPLVITDAQLDAALDAIEAALAELSR